MTMDLSNLLVREMMFFAVGLFAHLIRSDLKFPAGLYQGTYELFTVGIWLHGHE